MLVDPHPPPPFPLGINTSKDDVLNVMDFVQPKAAAELNKAKDLQAMLPHLKDLQLKSLHQAALRNRDEADGAEEIARYKTPSITRETIEEDELGDMVDLTSASNIDGVDGPGDNQAPLNSVKLLQEMQNALYRANTKEKGFIFMLDYVVNCPIDQTFPNLREVVPEVINPKRIWEANKEQAEAKLTTLGNKVVVDLTEDLEGERDIDLVCQFDRDAEGPDDNGLSSDDEDDIFGSTAKASPPAIKKVASKEDKSHLAVIIKAVQNIRLTAIYMKSKLDGGRYAVERSGKTYSQLRYGQLYGVDKVITCADERYYNSRLTVDSILQITQDEIDKVRKTRTFFLLISLMHVLLLANDRSQLSNGCHDASYRHFLSPCEQRI